MRSGIYEAIFNYKLYRTVWSSRAFPPSLFFPFFFFASQFARLGLLLQRKLSALRPCHVSTAGKTLGVSHHPLIFFPNGRTRRKRLKKKKKSPGFFSFPVRTDPGNNPLSGDIVFGLKNISLCSTFSPFHNFHSVLFLQCKSSSGKSGWNGCGWASWLSHGTNFWALLWWNFFHN